MHVCSGGRREAASKMLSVFLALTLAVGLCPSFAWAGEDPASTEPAGTAGEGPSLSAGFISESEGGPAADIAAGEGLLAQDDGTGDNDLSLCKVDYYYDEVQSGMTYREVINATVEPIRIYHPNGRDLTPTEDYQLIVTGPNGESVVTGLDPKEWTCQLGVAADEIAPVGVYSVAFTGIGDFEGTSNYFTFKVREGIWLDEYATVEITPDNMPLDDGVTQPEVSVVYRGPSAGEYSEGRILTPGEDYQIAFYAEDETRVEFPLTKMGLYHVVATGIGDCFGEAIGYFDVHDGHDIGKATIDYLKAVRVGSSDMSPVKSVTLGGQQLSPTDYTTSYDVWTWDERVDGFSLETWSGSGAPDEIGRYSFTLKGNASEDGAEGYYGMRGGSSYYYLVVPETYVGAVNDFDVVSTTINGREYSWRGKGDTRWDGFTQYAYTGSPAPIDVVLRKYKGLQVW